AAVFLAAPPALSAAQQEAVRGYVEAGGSLVVSAGPSTDAAALSRLTEALGVGRVEEIAAARSVQAADAIIGEVELRHPIFAVFAGGGRGAILQPRFRRYARLVPDSAATVLARYDTGHPMLAERRLGAGKVLAYTSSFSTAWTDFPLDESYVPFVYQLAAYAAESGAQRYQYTIGEAVALAGRPGETWDVRTPEGDVYQVPIGDDGAGFFRETEVPGHYVAARGAARYPFSVNVDPAESVLAGRDAEEVYAAVVPPPDDVPTTPEQAAAMAAEDEEPRQKLWRVLLLLALGLFAAETVLANRKRKDGTPQSR
ncbi:MAG: hypothetical protein R3247_12240, partial [Rhodothermales bacterium]|nr:hypothetical protein [Rhodothermales bacterium]